MPSQIVPAVLYAAKSTEDQKGSIPTQLEDARRMAEEEGWAVVDEFHDEGFSAYSGNRGPDLEAAKAAAIASAEEHGESMLVVQHSDRLARGAGDAPDAADHLGEVYFWARRHNVRLRSVQDDRDLEDALRAVLIGDRNVKDSERKSESVTSGKNRQFRDGLRLGGPVPDGLLLKVERDDRDRVVSRDYPRDPERAPVIERAFDLSEEGHGDPNVARMLNAEGCRTASGKPWTRRRVQHTLLNQIYAGRVVRKGRGGKKKYKKLDTPEVTEASNVEALIDPERYDRIIAARVARDKVGPEARKRGGRPTTRYALAKLGVCDRCGERMYVHTSPYKRKGDGKQRRSYVCANVKGCTGLCDQPRLDAEVIDTAVIAYLDELFVDFDAWQAELAQARNGQRKAAEAALDRATTEVKRLDRLAAKVRADYLKRMDAGEDGAAQVAADALADLKLKTEAVTAEAHGHHLALDGMEKPAEDALLDAYNALAKAVRGDGGEEAMADLNRRLRANFEEFRLDHRGGGEVGVLPILRQGEAPDVATAYEAWEEAGCPDPTAEEIEEWERVTRSPAVASADGVFEADLPPKVPALIWATGRDVVRPPARAFEALIETGSDTQL